MQSKFHCLSTLRLHGKETAQSIPVKNRVTAVIQKSRPWQPPKQDSCVKDESEKDAEARNGGRLPSHPFRPKQPPTGHKERGIPLPHPRSQLQSELEAGWALAFRQVLPLPGHGHRGSQHVEDHGHSIKWRRQGLVRGRGSKAKSGLEWGEVPPSRSPDWIKY